MQVSVYVRVSSEDQQERGTIENQIEFAKKYCDLHQLEIVEWYKDDGITGTIPLEMRDAGTHLLEDAKSGKFDLLLVHRLDRLGRSARIILNSVYELEQYGVKIKSMTEPFDTGDPSGRFLLTILAGVADLERETILDRMWHGANRAARAGKWLGGIVPYGYRVNNEGYLEINEDPLPGFEMSEADVVKQIYHMIADQGQTTIKVADYLNAIGAPPAYTKDGRKVKKGKRKENTAGIWRPGRIRNLVVNKTYMGIHEYGKRSKKQREIIEREVPAIVSPETWKKAQQTLRENKLEAIRNTKGKYLLKRLIKCGNCGRSYHGTYYSGPGRQPKGYYTCGGKGAYGAKCTSKNVPQKWLEDVVWEDIVRFVSNPGDTLAEATATKKLLPNKNIAQEIKLLQDAARSKEVEKESILDLFRKGIIDSQDVEVQFKNIDQEHAILHQRLVALEAEVSTEQELLERQQSAKELLEALQDKIHKDISFEEKRKVVKALVEQITIHSIHDDRGRPNAEVSIRYTFDSKVVTCTDMDSYLPPA